MMYDVKVDIEKVGGAADGSNSPELATFLEEEAKSLGIFNEVVGACPFGASEDFSYFMERVQSHGGQAAYMMVAPTSPPVITTPISISMNALSVTPSSSWAAPSASCS